MDEMSPGAQRDCVTFSNKQTNPKTDCAVTDFKTANNMKLKKLIVENTFMSSGEL